MSNRIWVQYAKRGRLRFSSHRDFARALERAIARAEIPMEYSQGFSPRPKISYSNAAPTGVASEAEYCELRLACKLPLEQVQARLDASLPTGLDIVAVDNAPEKIALSDCLTVSLWSIELPGVSETDLHSALKIFLSSTEVLVERLTSSGRRQVDTRGPVYSCRVIVNDYENTMSDFGQSCVILELVVQHVTPAVRPDDIVVGLCDVAQLVLPMPTKVTRLAQGMRDADGRINDPLQLNRDRHDVAGVAIVMP